MATVATRRRCSRELSNLLAFQNVVTQVAQTQVSVPLILTRGSIENQQRAAREKSIITLFHDVGFRTYWLSSQQREIAMAAISHYTDEADVVRFFERQHDMVLINAMREIFAKEGDRVQKRFFVLHMLGSHFNLTSRYPREFARYPDGLGAGMLEGTSASLGNAELINAYDNSILYTDYVLSQLVALLNEQPGVEDVPVRQRPRRQPARRRPQPLWTRAQQRIRPAHSTVVLVFGRVRAAVSGQNRDCAIESRASPYDAVSLLQLGAHGGDHAG